VIDRIEVWPVMGRLAIALRETVVFRFWCILLHLARQQSGGRRINNVIACLDDLQICGLISPRTLRRYLVRAKELGYVRGFIALGDDTYRIYFTGQKRVAKQLQTRAESKKIMNAEEWDRRKLFITFSDFAQITKFSGSIFASWLGVAIDYERRVTWEYLRYMWTVSRQSMEAWIATQPDIYRIENWGITSIPYQKDGTSWHGLLNEESGEYHIQRGNTYGVKNASQRFAAQGQIWNINGASGQSILSTCQGGSTSASPLTSRHNRHSARPPQNNPDAPKPRELRRNFKSGRAFAKQRDRLPTEPLYKHLYDSIQLRHYAGKARRVWRYVVPTQVVDLF
jgi:hypothetical protein